VARLRVAVAARHAANDIGQDKQGLYLPDTLTSQRTLFQLLDPRCKPQACKMTRHLAPLTIDVAWAIVLQAVLGRHQLEGEDDLNCEARHTCSSWPNGTCCDS
jgi:hypothetical protein